MVLDEWFPGYDEDWEAVDVDDEFREKVWEPYLSWRRRSSAASMRSSSVADHGSDFIKGLSEYYGVDVVDASQEQMVSGAYMKALEDGGADNLAKVLLEETVEDERKLKYYLDQEFKDNGGLVSGLRDLF